MNVYDLLRICLGYSVSQLCVYQACLPFIFFGQVEVIAKFVLDIIKEAFCSVGERVCDEISCSNSIGLTGNLKSEKWDI